MSAPNPVETFLVEADDLLQQVEGIALDLEQRPGDAEAINRLFRAFHTIKGSGAMFGFDHVAQFTHHVESTLDQVRAGRLAMSRPLIDLILAARDHLARLLQEPGADGGAASADLINAFTALAAGPAPGAAPAPEPPGAPAQSAASTWRIRFRPPPTLATQGIDPCALLDDLRSLGECRIELDASRVPPLAELAPEQCHLAWTIELQTSRGLNAIKDIFIFVEDESELVIETVASPVAATAEPAVARPAPVATAATSPGTGAERTRTAAADAGVRVPSGRLDRLVNLVGELVMNQSRLTQVAARSEDADLTMPVEELERLIAELRDTVLGIRMMPIGTTFSRFKRLVRDLSASLHKEVDLLTEGADTELDKTVLDQLGDPLVHLIRNSIDHGIELPEDRERAGKPRRGTIRLAASHTGSNVILTIADDGRGLDLAAIRQKAIEQKLITPDAALSPREVSNLIFLPGFSTASKVTSVSGRGVGMDVVKREIDALRGTLQLASEPGRGTTLSVTLPLTLAIIDGLLVELGGDRFIIPMAAVQENVELTRAERARHNGRNAIAVRGELVPYVRLRESFAVSGDGPELEKVVIVRHGGDRIGLVVDRVLGSHQTVIQSLGRFYRGIEVLSGATIMGDGRVALILDLAGLLRLAEAQGGRAATDASSRAA